MSTEISLYKQFEGISDGPNREALFDNLRLFGTDPLPVRFGFMLKGYSGGETRPNYVVGRILGIEAEDGSGHSWIINFQPHGFEGTDRYSVAEGSVRLYYRDWSGSPGAARKGHLLPLQPKSLVVRDGEIFLDNQKIADLPTQAI